MTNNILSYEFPENLTVMNDYERDIVEAFGEIRQDLELWGNLVDELLKDKVLTQMYVGGFVKITPSHRVKNTTSYLYKVLYRRHHYTNPLMEIQDKVGTRIVVLRSSDIECAKELILSYDGWTAVVTKTTRGQIEDQPKIFDYQSCHVVVYPKEEFTASALDRNILSCEIQIRTLLQHAFAEVSHDSAYKGPYRNDAEILRHLAKSMALMEATDDYFLKIFDLMSDQKREYSIFLKEIMNLYIQLVPEFDKSNIDYDVNDRLLKLKLQKEVSLSDLEAFIIKYEYDLKRAVLPKNGLLFTQPIILLVAYYLFTSKDWLKEWWPLNQQSLEGIYVAFNISFDNY